MGDNSPSETTLAYHSEADINCPTGNVRPFSVQYGRLTFKRFKYIDIEFARNFASGRSLRCKDCAPASLFLRMGAHEVPSAGGVELAHGSH